MTLPNKTTQIILQPTHQHHIKELDFQGKTMILMHSGTQNATCCVSVLMKLLHILIEDQSLFSAWVHYQQ